MSRSVLMLAYHYPPLGGVAVMRVLRFSRYLRDYGWEPIVVCVDGGAKHEPRDPDLMREVPSGIIIERVPCFEPDNYSDSWSVPREKVVRNLFKLFDKTLFPDDRAFWVGPVVGRIQSLVKKHRPAVLWATAQPWSTLVAGMRAKQATGIPLVLDFRDDWTTSNADFRRTKRLAKERALEQAVLSAADAVVSVTPQIVEALVDRRPANLRPEQFFLLPNGFDPAHFPFEPAVPSQVDAPFVLLHAGGLYDKRPVTPLLEILSRWLKEHPERRERLKVVLAGRSTEAVRTEIAGSALSGVIETPGFLSHGQVRKMMRTSGVNLLMIEQVRSAPWLFTGKAFEYLGARRPILMLGPQPSPLAELIAESGFGEVVGYGDVSRAVEVLERFYQERCSPVTINEAHIEVYDARKQSGVLAKILEGVAQT